MNQDLGFDGNDGSAPDKDHALQSIQRAMDLIESNYTVMVAAAAQPYPGGVSNDRADGRNPQSIRLSAEDGVVIDASASSVGAGIRLSNADNSVIEGFVIAASVGAGISIISGSDGVTIRHCVVRGSGDDGIRIHNSADVLVFNNLVYGSGGIGIALVGDAGSPLARVFNNTTSLNVGRGITVGTSSGASTGATLLNNIVQQNGNVTTPENLRVLPLSISGFRGNFDLVFPATYSPANLRGSDDVNADARFVRPGVNRDPTGFRLQLSSPAVDAGSDYSGQPDAVRLRQTLRERSVLLDGSPDTGIPDLGYHFPR